MGGELLTEPPGGDALEGADQPGHGDFGRVVHEQVDVVAFPVELPSSVLKSVHTSRMTSSQRRRISSVNGPRRYLGVKTKCA